MTADGSSGDSSARDGAGCWDRSSSCAGVGAWNRGGAASTVTLRAEGCLRGRRRGAVEALAVASGSGMALRDRASAGGPGVAGGAATGSFRRVSGATTDLDDSSEAGPAGYPDTGDLNTSKRHAKKAVIRKNVTVTRAAGRSWVRRRRIAINARAAHATARGICPSDAEDSTSTVEEMQTSLPLRSVPVAHAKIPCQAK
jgi:hypothetical protein